MRPDRTAKSIGFSVWRISPKVQRIHRKKRKTPRKRAPGQSRREERGRGAGRSARTRPTGSAKERTASARESGSASSPRKRRASTAAPDAPARRRTKAKRSAVGTVTERFKVAQRHSHDRLRLDGMVAASPRVAVIGGGLAGLVAADRLLGAGVPVTLFGKYPGGGGLGGLGAAGGEPPQ